MVSLEAVFGKDAAVLRDRNFQILLLANINGPLAVSLISPLLDSLTGPFGVSEARIGLMVTLVAAPSVVLIVFLGVLADRFGRKPILISALLFFGIGGLLIPFTTDFRVVMFLRVIQGIGFAGLTPIVVTSIGDFYQGQPEVTAQGLRFTGTGFISTISPVFAGVLVVIGWQFPFFIYGIAIPVAVIMYLWFEEPLDYANARSHGSLTTNNNVQYFQSLKTLATNRRVLLILLSRSLPPFVNFGFLTYVSFLVRVLNGTPQQAGIIVAISAVIYATTATQLGRLSGLFPNRFHLLITAHLLFFAGLTIQAFAPSMLILAVGVIVMGFGVGIAVPLYRSVITEFASDSLRGGLMSISETLGRVSVTLAPIVLGVMISTLQPSIGFNAAVRTTVIVMGIYGGLVGIVLVFASSQLPPLSNTTQ